jgi:hypothetical protein
MPAIDHGRGRRAFRAVEHDTERVTINADNSEVRTRDRCLRGRSGFGIRHDLLKSEISAKGETMISGALATITRDVGACSGPIRLAGPHAAAMKVAR